MTRLSFAPDTLALCGTALVCARRRIYAATPPLNHYSCSCGWLAWSPGTRLLHLLTPILVPKPFPRRPIRFCWLLSRIVTWIRIGVNWHQSKVVLSCRYFLIRLSLDLVTVSGVCLSLLPSLRVFRRRLFPNYPLSCQRSFRSKWIVSTVFSMCYTLSSTPVILLQTDSWISCSFPDVALSSFSIFDKTAAWSFWFSAIEASCTSCYLHFLHHSG